MEEKQKDSKYAALDNAWRKFVDYKVLPQVKKDIWDNKLKEVEGNEINLDKLYQFIEANFEEGEVGKIYSKASKFIELSEKRKEQRDKEEIKEYQQKCNVTLNITNYIDNAEEFWNVNPYFYDDQMGIFWMWNKKEFKYDMIKEPRMMDMFDTLLGFQGQTVPSTIKNNHLEAFKRFGIRNRPKDAPIKWIQFKDKAFSIESKNIYDVKPNYFFTNPIPWEIGETDETPFMDNLFIDWVGKENLDDLYEFIAYCCYRDYPIQLLFCLYGHGRNGKCYSDKTKVLMSNGLWKNVKDLQKNDEVISVDKDGKYCYEKVKETHSHFENDMYQVIKEKDNQILYECSGDHLIPIIRTWSKRTSKDDSTPRIYERRKFEYSAKKLNKLSNYKSEICCYSSPLIEFKNPIDIELDAYCLGALLGDGHMGDGISKKGYKIKRLSLTTMDKEVINYFKEKYSNDYLRSYNKKDNKAKSYHFKVNGVLAEQLENLGLFGKVREMKDIPYVCLRTTSKYRWDLLGGLIDTDGFIDKNGAIYFVNKSLKLCKSIEYLVFSLGGTSSLRKINKSCGNFIGIYYELSISFKDKTIIPLKIPFKKERLKKVKYNPIHFSIKVEQSIPQQVYGFEISGNTKHIITDSWTIGHNSTFIKIVDKFLGNENTCTTDLDMIAGKNKNRFETLRLYKKLACFMGETNFNILENSSILKKLVGGDKIAYEIKGAGLFDDFNYSKIIIASNSLPSSEDTSEGFYRRWHIIDFPNEFPEGKDISLNIPEQEFNNLAKKIIKILPDLLNKGKFTNQGTIAERKKKYIMASNPLPLFIENYCSLNPNGNIRYSKFYHIYTKFLDSIKRRIVSKKEFSKILVSEGLENRRTSKDGDVDFYVEGVELKEDCLDCLDFRKFPLNPYTVARS